MQNVHFSTRQIAGMLGVNESTIKRWVDRGMLPATKTPGGHRRISQTDLIAFRKKHPLNKKKSYTLRSPRTYTDADSLWEEYYKLLYTNHAEQAKAIIVNAYLRNMSIVEIATTIIIPTLQNIGKEWVGGNIEIHDEHRMSFHVREHLLALNQIIPEPKKAKNVVLACIAGDWHEIPLQISALILKSEGWKPIVLGVNTPEEEILSAAKQWNAKIITVIKIYTKNKRKEYLESLEKFANDNNILLAYGGNGWSKKWHQLENKKNRKYIKHFGDISLFAKEVMPRKRSLSKAKK